MSPNKGHLGPAILDPVEVEGVLIVVWKVKNVLAEMLSLSQRVRLDFIYL